MAVKNLAGQEMLCFKAVSYYVHKHLHIQSEVNPTYTQPISFQINSNVILPLSTCKYISVQV